MNSSILRSSTDALGANLIVGDSSPSDRQTPRLTTGKQVMGLLSPDNPVVTITTTTIELPKLGKESEE